MWKATALHKELGIRYVSDNATPEVPQLLALTVNLGIGSNDNSISVEIAGELDVKAGTFDVSFQYANEPEATFYGFEIHDFAYNIVQEQVISTTIEATFGDIPVTLQEMIKFIEDNGIPETNGVNLVKAERGYTECLEEQVTPDALIQIVINRMRQASRNPTDFYKVLEKYGLGFVQPTPDSRELIFINEPELDEEGEPITFTETILESHKFNGNVYNRAGDFLVRRITGQAIADASGASSFDDGEKEPAIPINNPQIGTYNKEFIILSERDKLRNNSDELSNVQFELNPNIRPRHLFEYKDAQYLVRKVTHTFDENGDSTTIDANLYQTFLQPDSVVIHIERKQGRVVESYVTPHEWLPKTLDKDGSSNPRDWRFNTDPSTSFYEKLTDAGMTRDILGLPVVGDRLRAVVKAIECPDRGSEQYQWMRIIIDDFGAQEVPISGANNASYVVQEKDVGFIIGCRIQYRTAGTRITDTPIGRTQRLAVKNIAGEAQLTIGDVDTVAPILAVIGRIIASTGITSLFLTGVGAASTFTILTANALRAGLSFANALSIATTIVKSSPLRFIGPLAGVSVPLSVYSAFHGLALISALNVPKQDLRKLIGDSAVILTLKDYEGAIATNLIGNTLDDGTTIYNDALIVTWEFFDDGAWKEDKESTQTHRFHNLIAVMNYEDDAQVKLVEDGHFMVGALIPSKELEGKLVRARIRPYYDHLDPVPGASIEVFSPVPAPPNPEIVTEPVRIPVNSVGGLRAQMEPAEPAGGFQANSGEAVTLVFPASERRLISSQIVPVHINVTRYNDEEYTQIDETFSQERGQVTGFPPLSYVFQAPDESKFPGIDDTGKYFEFRMEFTVGAYHFLSEPVRLKKAVRAA